MIRIRAPYLEEKDGLAYLKTELSIPLQQETVELWYAVDAKYVNYLVYEVADAFVLGTICFALYTGQDIESEAPVSEKLLFHLNYGLLDMLSASISDGKTIKVHAEPLFTDFGGKAVVTGCSLGVDSFSTILRQMEDSMMPSYKLTHVSISNTGHFGDDDTRSARDDFYKAVRDLEQFSKEIGLCFLWIDSNISDLYRCIPKQHFVTSLVERTISAPMCLQKMFRKYVIATSNPATLEDLNSTDSEDAMNVTVPLMSTDSMEVVVSNPMMTRVDKIEYISDNYLVKRYLDVCWYARIKNMNREFQFELNKTKRNCGKCGKCLRTLFTFELLGKIDEFKDLFDLDEYYKHRNKYIIKVLSERDNVKGSINSEIYNLMKIKDYKVPLYIRISALMVRNGILKLLPRKLLNQMLAR